MRSCLLAAFLAATAFGQTGASIGGRVTDPQQSGIPRAIVTLYARDTGTRTTAKADAQGTYRFTRLAPGDYLIEAAAPGFARAIAPAVVVGRDAGVALDLSLPLAGVTQQVVVTASGSPQPVDEVSKAITTIDRQEVERRDEYAIAEALRTVPGLRVQQLGGPGAFTSIKTRGLRNEDTAVLFDGLRFRDAAAPQGDASGFLEDLIFTDTDRIEVLRGSGSSLYGTNAIGGVVNIVTDEGGGPARGSLLLEGGSLGLVRGRAHVAGGFHQLDYSAGLAHLNVTTGVDGDDPARNTSGQGRVQWRLAPAKTVSGRVYTAGSFFKLNTGPQAAGNLPPAGIIDAVPLSRSGATFIPSTNDPDYSRAARFFAGALTFSSRTGESFGYSLHYQGLTTNHTLRDGPAGAGFQPAGNTRTAYDGRIHTANARLNWRVAPWSFIDAGYEFENETYRNRSFMPNPSANSAVDVSQQSHALFFQDQLRLLRNRLQIAAAFRTQFFSPENPRFTPSASSPYQGLAFPAPPNAYTGDGSIAYFFQHTGTKLRAHAGNGYRAPSLYERYGASFGIFGYSAFGDPRLPPDRSIAFDAGVDQALLSHRVRASATYFYTRLQRVIIFDFSGAIQPATDPFGRFGGYRGTNGGLARGAELSATLAPTRSLDWSVAYTYTKAAQRTPVVPGVLRFFVIPDHQFSTVVTQRLGSRFFVNFDLTASSDYLAPIFDTATFSSRAYRFDGIIKADFGASYRLGRVRLFGKIDNLLNRGYYESGFRVPGLTAVAGVELKGGS
jgi:vitamin B12 transporter